MTLPAEEIEQPMEEEKTETKKVKKKKKKTEKVTQLTIFSPKVIDKLIAEASKYHIGVHGRTKDTELAGERLIAIWGALIGLSKILGWEFEAGPETHKVARNGDGWDVKKNRHEGGTVGKAGLSINIFNKLAPHRSGSIAVWPRPFKNNLSYPVYNIPSDICTPEEVAENGYKQLQDHFASKELWYLVLRLRENHTIKEYTLGRYQDIPRKNYVLRNKNNNKEGKLNEAKFPKYKLHWRPMYDNQENAIAELEETFA
jgi:hypothetical protein